MQNISVMSKDDSRRLEVVQRTDGGFELHEYFMRYNREEDVSYESRSMPNPGGIYADPAFAETEAKRLIDL